MIFEMDLWVFACVLVLVFAVLLKSGPCFNNTTYTCYTEKKSGIAAMKRFQGKVAIITGSTMGIGLVRT